MKPIYVFGHKNPDTDSVCSAIALAYLKNALGFNAIPKVIGQVNRGTLFALDYFKVSVPSYLNDVKIQIEDIKYNRRAYISSSSSIDDAFNYMKEHELNSVPLVKGKNKLDGYVSLRSMARFLVSSNKNELHTNINHLLKTLDAKIITNYQDEFSGFISSVSFSDDDSIEEFNINDKSIVIVGNRKKIIDLAINQKAELIILTKGRKLNEEQVNSACKNKVTVITSSYSGFEVCTKIIFANNVNLLKMDSLTINATDYYSDFVSLAKRTRHHMFPVLGKDNTCLGLLNVADSSNFERKKVILVDHNNYEESIDGLEEADILEIVDHHSLGTIGTKIPISFISKPVGCTATIIYEQFENEKVNIPSNIAGLLLSAIISDTLLFTSPTTTKEDIEIANKLANIANVDIEKYGKELLKVSSSVKGLSIDELITQDFKRYQISGKTYGITVIQTMDFEELKEDMPKYINRLNEMSKTNYKGVMIFILDIFKNGSYVIYDDKSEDLIASAFKISGLYEGYFIKGLVSRKKQILPAILKELES